MLSVYSKYKFFLREKRMLGGRLIEEGNDARND